MENPMNISTISTQLSCLAPAKLNLFLHVTGQREDGYHLLQTAFQLIDRCDQLHFKVRSDGVIHRTNFIEHIPESDDLVVRAAQLLKKHTGSHLGADITLEKKIPTGAGLGGGSSDAASTLMALNYLWQCKLTEQELMQLGVQLGADVPFFLFGENAFAEGIGDELHALPSSNHWYVVIEPGVHVPTAAIFSSKELTRNTKRIKITDFSNATKLLWKNDLKNDLQAVTCALFPAIKAAIIWLNQFGDAKMTGSGASVFCAFSSEEAAKKVCAQVPNAWVSWVAKALNQHPMHDVVG
jgi:4-diphosphocytidyl-2-C-methyl-D-erythritol kinase